MHFDTRVKISVSDRKETKDTLIIQDLRIEKIQSGGHKSSIDSEARNGEISVGVLYAGEVKDFIIRLGFSSTVSSNGRTRSSAVTAAVEYYKDISSKRQQQLSKRSKQQCKVPLLVTSSNNSAARDAYKDLEPNSRVLQQMILFEVVEELEKEAKTTTTNNNMYVGAGLNLRKWWDELKSKGNLHKARENDLVDLQRIDEAMAAMASRLEGGSGLGCIYSWVSSYEMQRATTTGLPLPPPPFLTPAMKEAARNLQVATRQRAVMLLDKLEKLFDDYYQHTNGVIETYNFVKRVHEVVVKEAINGGTRTRTTTTTCASGSGDKKMPAAATLDDLLEDDIKSTIAIRLLDYCTIKFKRSSSEVDLPKMYQAAEVAITCWRRVQERSLPAAAASRAPPAQQAPQQRDTVG